MPSAKIAKSAKASAKPGKVGRPSKASKATAPPKKRRAEKEPEPEEPELEAGAEDSEPEVAASDSEPEPEPAAAEVDDDDEEDEPDEDAVRKAKKAKMRRNKKAKLVGYRNLARQAGYLDRVKGDANAASGRDGTAALLSTADAKRLMRFVPAMPGNSSFGLSEFEQRMSLFKQGVSAAAARETQARADAAMRAVMNEVVLRAAEAGKKTITPSAMASVLRPYAQQMLFTAVQPPLGLIRYAQVEGILSTTQADKDSIPDEKKDNLAAKKMFEAYEKSEAERVAAMRAARAAKAAA